MNVLKLTKVQTLDRIPGNRILKSVLLVAKLQNTPTLKIFIETINEWKSATSFRAREHPIWHISV